MNCEEISEKAISIGIKPDEIHLIKEPYNGWRVEALLKSKKLKKKIEKLKKKISYENK